MEEDKQVAAGHSGGRVHLPGTLRRSYLNWPVPEFTGYGIRPVLTAAVGDEDLIGTFAVTGTKSLSERRAFVQNRNNDGNCQGSHRSSSRS